MAGSDIYFLDTDRCNESIGFTRARYVDNDNLAISMYVADSGWREPYAHLTVNIEDLDDPEAAIDTNNLGDDIVDWLEDNEIAYFTGEYLQSGFCSYPVVSFDEEWLEDVPEE